MTKAYAAKKRNPIPPTKEAIRTAHVLDTVLELRPLKPPMARDKEGAHIPPKCRICWGTGCSMCGKKPQRKRETYSERGASLWQKGDR